MSSNSRKEDPVSEALFYACLEGNFAKVRDLLQNGADANSMFRNSFPLLVAKTEEINDGRTPLHHAAANQRMEISQVLLDHGSLVNAKDSEGKTPLHWCLHPTRFGEPDIEMVQLLLDCGAEVNAACMNGWTPLHTHMLNLNPKIAKLLLERGGNLDAADNHGETPLHKAVFKLASWEDAHFPIQSETVLTLLNHGAKLEAVDHARKTPLQYAAEIGHYETIQLLVGHGANTATMDIHGNTPLHYGARVEDQKVSQNIVRFLLEHGEFFFCAGEAQPGCRQSMKKSANTPIDNCQAKKPKNE